MISEAGASYLCKFRIEEETVGLNLGEAQISAGDLSGPGHSGKRSRTDAARKAEVEEGWWRAVRWQPPCVRMIELEGATEARSLEVWLTMTEPERDPELESNRVGKLNDINRGGGIIVFAFGKSP